MLQVMEKGHYEHVEVKTLRNMLEHDDIVLEIGAGVGVVSTAAAKIISPDNIVVVEANPELTALISETHCLSGVEGIKVISGVGVGDSNQGHETFYLRDNFWASSLIPPAVEEKVRAVTVPRIDLNSILLSLRPTVFVLDIEGAELELLGQLELNSCRSLILELHPKVYGLAGTDLIFKHMRKQGFVYDPVHSKGEGVVVFSRLQ